MWQAHLETASYAESRNSRRKSLKMAVRLPFVTRKLSCVPYRNVVRLYNRPSSSSCRSNRQKIPSFASAMADYSILSADAKRGDAPTTSTPLLESTYVRRRKRRLENYLAGACRAAVHIDRDLQRSLSSNQGSVEDIPADMAAKRQKRVEECSRGCPAVLQNLAKTYQSVGRHCWPVRMYRQNEYPSPLNDRATQTYRNIVGE